MRIALLFRCLLLFALFFKFTNSKASHVMGSEILYECTGNGTYKVTVKVYRDCHGIALSQSNLVALSGPDSVVVSNQTKISVRDITGTYNGCQLQSRCSGSGSYGIEEHIWEMSLDLSSYSNCDWLLKWEQCCRNGNITTGQANQNFYTTASLNKCLGSCNSSPVFRNSPSAVFIVCANRDVIYDSGASDTIDQDSLSYHLATPLQGFGTATTYSGQFGPTRPLTFWGYPNLNLAAPAGFHLDPTTGELRFRPVQLNQVAVLVIEVKEWRMVNGIMTHIGTIRRDIQVIVINCPSNQTPQIQGTNTATVCPGDRVCFPITTTDGDLQDTVQISWNKGIPGATFTNNNGQVRLAQGEVCWTPDTTHPRTDPYIFRITARDQVCFSPGIAIKDYAVYVIPRDSAMQITFQVQRSLCGMYRFSHTTGANYAGYKSLYTLRDSMNQIIWVSTRMSDSLFLPFGTYQLRLSAYADNYCHQDFNQSFVVNQVDTLTAMRNSNFCLGNDQVLQLPYLIQDSIPNYRWYQEVQSNQLTYLGQAKTWPVASGTDGTYIASDSQLYCIIKDTFQVAWHQAPELQISADEDSVCYGTAIQFSDSLMQGSLAYRIWYFGDGDTSTAADPQHTYAFADSSFRVTHIAENVYGCRDIDSLQVLVHPEITLASLSSLTVKANDSCSFTVGQSAFSLNYQWQLDTGSGFQDMVNNSFYSGTNTHTLRISKTDKTMDGHKFRCMTSYFDCSKVSDTANLTITSGTGIRSWNSEDIRVYPNPSDGVVYLEYAEFKEPVLVQILSSTGQVVQSFELNSSLQRIDLHDLAPGMYLIWFESHEMPIQRFIKQ